MNKQQTMYIGNKEASFEANEVKGNLVMVEDESYYKISNVDEMRPFFMSIVSNSNHWMFLSSNGGLSAGRKNSENALILVSFSDAEIKKNQEKQMNQDSQNISTKEVVNFV